ncbi:MAG: hypothetical protein J0L61_00805 [Planctomycetes bacterium]|nr:hypothetical protein [Planctomycetota bacterium]
MLKTRVLFRAGGVVALSLAAAPAFGVNLVTNGDFENPTLAGINSDYLHTPGGNVVEGSWWVNPWDSGSPWFGTQHTPGGRGAMSVNGDNSTQAGVKRVWYQTINVTPGTEYDFSAWMLGTAAGFSGYSLQFAFDGVAIGAVNSPSAALVWESFNASFTATAPTVTISIVNVSGITFPNDFMIDDIALQVVPAPGVAGVGGLAIGLFSARRRRTPR